MEQAGWLGSSKGSPAQSISPYSIPDRNQNELLPDFRQQSNILLLACIGLARGKCLPGLGLGLYSASYVMGGFVGPLEKIVGV